MAAPPPSGPARARKLLNLMPWDALVLRGADGESGGPETQNLGGRPWVLAWPGEVTA